MIEELHRRLAERGYSDIRHAHGCVFRWVEPEADAADRAGRPRREQQAGRRRVRLRPRGEWLRRARARPGRRQGEDHPPDRARRSRPRRRRSRSSPKSNPSGRSGSVPSGSRPCATRSRSSMNSSALCLSLPSAALGDSHSDLRVRTGWRRGPAADSAGPFLLSYTEFTPDTLRDVPAIYRARDGCAAKSPSSRARSASPSTGSSSGGAGDRSRPGPTSRRCAASRRFPSTRRRCAPTGRAAASARSIGAATRRARRGVQGGSARARRGRGRVRRG